MRQLGNSVDASLPGNEDAPVLAARMGKGTSPEQNGASCCTGASLTIVTPCRQASTVVMPRFFAHSRDCFYQRAVEENVRRGVLSVWLRSLPEKHRDKRSGFRKKPPPQSKACNQRLLVALWPLSLSIPTTLSRPRFVQRTRYRPGKLLPLAPFFSFRLRLCCSGIREFSRTHEYLFISHASGNQWAAVQQLLGSDLAYTPH